MLAREILTPPWDSAPPVPFEEVAAGLSVKAPQAQAALQALARALEVWCTAFLV